jgi:hypothetical protein
MKKKIMRTLLGVLLISILGAAVVSAVTADNVKTGYGCGFGNRHGWGIRNMDSGYCTGNFSSCPYFNSTGTVELKVGTIDKAFETARAKIDDKVSEENIYQMGRWWIVSYKNDDGVSSQARIDAVTGEVFTGYTVSAGQYASGMYRRGSGFCRAGY